MAPPASLASLANRAAAAEALVGLCTSPAPAGKTAPSSRGVPISSFLPAARLPPREEASMRSMAANLPVTSQNRPPAPLWNDRHDLGPQAWSTPSGWSTPSPPHLYHVPPPMTRDVPAAFTPHTMLLSQISAGGLSSVLSFRSLVHPRGNDLLSTRPGSLSAGPAGGRAGSDSLGEAHSAQVPRDTKSHKRRRGDDSPPAKSTRFCWVTLQPPPGKAEAGRPAPPPTSNEKPLKKLRGHSGYSWKPL